MSENITHTGIVDDCRRLASVDQGLHPVARGAFARYQEIAQLGGITRGGDRCNPGLLARFKDDLDRGTFELDGRDGQKLAFVLGWLGHRATDRQLKPVFRELDGECPRKPTDCSVYHDACVLREVYGLVGAPYDPDLLAHEEGGRTAGLPPEVFAAVHRVGKTALQRALIEVHTLIPDLEDPDGWLDRLLATFQRHRVGLDRYAEAVLRPDPDRWRRFVEEPPFYRADDEAIALARAIGRGEIAEDCDVAVLLAARDPVSCYGKALDRAYGCIRAAGDFLAGAIDHRELEARLQIGRPELAG